MRIFLICSKRFYSFIPDIQTHLEKCGHIVTLPNCYDKPETEETMRNQADYPSWKRSMLEHSTEVIKENDAVLVLNYQKDEIPNYIGGATFLEMYDAFRLNKKIYLMNPIPEGILKDEIRGLDPIILNQDITKI